MREQTREEFKEAMRKATEISQEIADISETPKRKPGRPKREEDPLMAAAARKRGPKSRKIQEAAATEKDKQEEALKALIDIAEGWVTGKKVDADRYMKISEDITAKADKYQGYINTVKEMIG